MAGGFTSTRSYMTGKNGDNWREWTDESGGGGGGVAAAEVGRFLLTKAEKTNERGAPFACLRKKKKKSKETIRLRSATEGP